MMHRLFRNYVQCRNPQARYSWQTLGIVVVDALSQSPIAYVQELRFDAVDPYVVSPVPLFRRQCLRRG